jgi:hypothetical protein
VLDVSGILEEFVPQYKTGGATMFGLVVAFLLLLSPLAFSPNRRGTALATFFTMAGVVGQLTIMSYVVLQAGIFAGSGAESLPPVIALVLTGALTILIVRYAKRSLTTPAPTVA